jgi:hypothetical protein
MELVSNLEVFYKHNLAKGNTEILTEIHLLLPSVAIIFCSYN